MSDEAFQAALRAEGVLHGYWAHHPRPWRIDPRGYRHDDGSYARFIVDASGGTVLSDYGVGFDDFWASYCRAAATEEAGRVPR